LIKNFNELATTENRKIALQIMEAGFGAINTEKIINSSISLIGNILFVKGKGFNLAKFEKIKVIGFGKSSIEATLALEKILKSRIKEGAVIGLKKASSEFVEIFSGTHPKPSEVNIEAGKKIYQIVSQSNKNDLIIAIVSGGGSALLCYPESECVQGIKLYDASLKSGETINETDVIRKHLSILKGGGLVKLAYPATVIGLIFSDIPGNNFENVASGPTYKDKTTIADTEKIIIENNLGKFDLIETPKEDKYFNKVYNFVLVSNKTAINAMKKKATEFNLETKIASTELYDVIKITLQKIFSVKNNNTVVLAAGEPSIVVKNSKGKGGRNLHMGLQAIKDKLVDDNSLFISFASDGKDNTDVAGAIVDKNTIEKLKKLNIDVNDYLKRFDSYSVFQKSGDVIITGPTGANVSDLMILLTKK